MPSLNAHLANGDFLAVEQEDGNLLSVCRVINVVYPNEIRVTWWLRNEQLSALQLQFPPPVDESYYNLRKCCIKEVTERVLAIRTIRTCQVRDQHIRSRTAFRRIYWLTSYLIYPKNNLLQFQLTRLPLVEKP